MADHLLTLSVGSSKLPIDVVHHRIAHGGAHFTAPVRIGDDTMFAMAAIEPLGPMLPLHDTQVRLAGGETHYAVFGPLTSGGASDIEVCSTS